MTTPYRETLLNVGRLFLPFSIGAPRLRGRAALAVGARAEGGALAAPGARSPPDDGHKYVPLARQQADGLLPVALLLSPALVGDCGAFRAREGRRPDGGRSQPTCPRRGGRWWAVLGPMAATGGAKLCFGAPPYVPAATQASLFSRAALLARGGGVVRGCP